LGVREHLADVVAIVEDPLVEKVPDRDSPDSGVDREPIEVALAEPRDERNPLFAA